MTNNEMLAQAVRNRIAQYKEGILRAEGAINELGNVLATIEGGSGVVGAAPGAGAGGGSERASSTAALEDRGAGGGEVGGAGGPAEASAQGTDGGST